MTDFGAKHSVVLLSNRANLCAVPDAVIDLGAAQYSEVTSQMVAHPSDVILDLPRGKWSPHDLADRYCLQ
jgi:hypothetical protein